MVGVELHFLHHSILGLSTLHGDGQLSLPDPDYFDAGVLRDKNFRGASADDGHRMPLEVFQALGKLDFLLGDRAG